MVAALGVQQAWALSSKFVTHTTSRYALERGAVSNVGTGDPAGEIEVAKWKESGKMSYDVQGRGVSLAVLHGGFGLHREGQ
ncbi:MAG TPA: hypothetical protein VIK91_04390 [Nannocystis sp.]